MVEVSAPDLWENHSSSSASPELVKPILLQSDPWQVRIPKEGDLKSKKPPDVAPFKKKPGKPERTKPKRCGLI